MKFIHMEIDEPFSSHRCSPIHLMTFLIVVNIGRQIDLTRNTHTRSLNYNINGTLVIGYLFTTGTTSSKRMRNVCIRNTLTRCPLFVNHSLPVGDYFV